MEDAGRREETGGDGSVPFPFFAFFRSFLSRTGEGEKEGTAEPSQKPPSPLPVARKAHGS